MKKNLLFVLLFFPIILFSQQFEIIEVDTSNYPIVSAKFIALDASMDIIKDLTISESEILENDISQNIVKIINPKDTNLMQSVVLVVDVSGSMSGTNIDLAQKAITEFINLTPFTFTELAILTFNSDLYVNQDFTRNKNKLLNAVNRLRAGGGTNYDVALLDDKNSALNLTSTRNNSKPVIIFLTDGLSSANHQQVASIANSQGAKIYTITLNMPIPNDLAEITLQTNAKYYENISTVEEAKRAYLSILFQIYQLYGQVFWEAERSCDELVSFSFNTRDSMRASYFYEIDPSKTKGVFFNRQIVAFDLYSSDMNRNILIGANTSAVITGINVKDSVNFNTYYDFSVPTSIVPGQTLPIKVYRPTINEQIYTEVEVSTDVCPPKKFYIFQGNIADFVIPGNLKVHTPNGGESYFSGEFTDIKWRNKTSNKLVNIYLSTDAGNNYTWMQQTSNNSYNWLVPGIPSDRCLIKVAIETEPMELFSANEFVNQLQVTPSGSKFVYSSRKKLIFASTSSGYTIDNLYFNRPIKNFKLSPINNDAIVELRNKLYVYNSVKNKTKKIKHRKENIVDYFYSDNGQSVFVIYKNKNFIYEFDAKNGRKMNKYQVGSSIKDVSFNAGIVSIITQNKKWIIWDVIHKQKVFELKNIRGFLLTDVNYSGDYAVAIDQKNKIYYWSKSSNDTVLSVQHVSAQKPNVLKFNPKNNTLLCCKKGKDIVYYAANDVLFQYIPPRNISISHVDFNPNGTELIYAVLDRGFSYINRFNFNTLTVTSSKNSVYFSKKIKDFSFNQNGNIGAFHLTNGYSMYLFRNENNSTNDVSDSLFTIKTYTPLMKDTIRLPDVYVGSEATFLDDEVFFNPHRFPAVVDFIDFYGSNSTKFGLISGIPPLGITPNSKAGVEFSFFGGKIPGVYKSRMIAICGTDTLSAVIIAKTIKRPVDVTNAKIDLGTVNMTASLEKSIELFSNVTDSVLVIDSVVNWGPDYNQISLSNNLKSYQLPVNEKIPFHFTFIGENRGATNAVFLVYLQGMPEPLKINVSGKVYAPYKITVKCNVINSLDNSPVSTTIKYFDAQNNRYIANAVTNSSGELTLSLPNELSYKFVAYGVNEDSAFVDLSDVFVDTVIFVNLSVLKIQNGMKFNLQNANFDVGSASLFSNTKQELNKLVSLMNIYPQINIVVDGHTDNEGNYDFNIDLSNKRANSVKQYLVSKGINASRITTKGYGDTKPLSSNSTDDGKAENRRIEITINK